jgi:hypothetical protein
METDTCQSRMRKKSKPHTSYGGHPMGVAPDTAPGVPAGAQS